MTSDALFGPDGTQLPEPLPVLPDPLVGPGTPAAAGQHPLALPPVPMPAGVDPAAMREAIRAALGDERTVRSPAQAPQPERPGPSERHVEMLRTPPTGIPVQPGYRPPPRPAGQFPGQSVGMGGPARYPGPPPAVQRQPGLPPAVQRQPAPSHPIESRRGPSGGGWIGCVVLLIFIAIVVYNLVSSLIDAFTGG